MQPVRGEFEILSLKCQKAGYINMEIMPLNSQNKPDTEKDLLKTPEKDLIKKQMTLVVNLNQTREISDIYEVNRKLCLQ